MAKRVWTEAEVLKRYHEVEKMDSMELLKALLRCNPLGGYVICDSNRESYNLTLMRYEFGPKVVKQVITG